MSVDPETDVRDLVRAQRLASQPERPAQDQLSRRAEKKVCVSLRAFLTPPFLILKHYVEGKTRRDQGKTR